MLKILSDLGPFENTQGLPFDVFQIDDGWQVGIGDWEPNAKFFSGMDKLATQIHGTGRKAGLWLAPLLIVPSSNIYREHRDWLLHEENGSLVSAGFNWGEPLYALDTTHPTALYWLVDLMKKVRGWGYDYAKLDFLYAGALPGKRYLDIPRETAYRNGLRTIRGALGDAYLLTCGAPILPSIGLCDGIRVGPDMAGHFTSHLDDDLIMNFATPGGRNALRTSFNRLWLQPLVHTDPDVVYFRSRQSNLTPKQKSLLEDMAQICNFKATSDIPAWLTDSERYSLREFLESRPEVRKTGRTTYQIGDHEVDFALYIDLPPLPGPLTNLLGVIVGGLANIPFVLRLLDWLGRRSVRKTLAKDPV
jgi:alpha-galactosidase